MADREEISVVLGGAAGQGIQTVESILANALAKAGYHVYATKEYMSRVRGGVNTTELRISTRPVRAFVNRADLVIPFISGVLSWLGDRVSETTHVVGERANVEDRKAGSFKLVEAPMTKMALEAGGPLYLNTVAAGVVAGILGVELGHLESFLKERFSSKGKDVVAKNVAAARLGHEHGVKLTTEGAVNLNLERPIIQQRRILLSGTEAVALGAIAGGLDFVSFYPMSPSTGVPTFCAQHAERFGVVVEQVEDEIAALNMAIGAWHGGARALVSTSGGGFALMTEALSLAGMSETPVVIHLAQRPGPATGLPTRTMQGDLNLVLHAGHGDFPRIILAPGTVEEAFHLSSLAMNLADRYQVPVILLTDQYFVDTYHDVSLDDLHAISEPKRHVVPAEKGYRRYDPTTDGISPRAVPGSGPEVVVANGYEHDEWGDITEDASLTVTMQDKRVHLKGRTVRDAAMGPSLHGDPDAPIVVVTWGATRPMVEEALRLLASSAVAHLHFSWIHPLPDQVRQILEDRRIIVVENNVTGQFASFLERESGIRVDEKILKYDGRPFTVEEVADSLKEVL